MLRPLRVLLVVDILITLAFTPRIVRDSGKKTHRHRRRLAARAWSPATTSNRANETCNACSGHSALSPLRRALFAGVLASPTLFLSDSARAVDPILSRLLDRQSSLYILSPENNVTVTPQREPLFSEPYYLSSEICLLKLLPVKNPLFRSLENSITSLSSLEASSVSPEAWKRATQTIEEALQELDQKRGQLAPVFNPEDSTMLSISKGERGERLIENLRRRMVRLVGSTGAANLTKTLSFQKDALLALSEVGELLVTAFPYEVPAEGRFSYLPRLLGRARVTFSFRRKGQNLGNVTIVADGYTAPISAGNFVDLCVRNFYTGLPVKFSKRRLGSGSDFEVASFPVLGSFQEGFYDPLTAKPRRIPLEIIRVENFNGSPNLSYLQGPRELKPFSGMVLEPTSASRPLLSFNIPGLVALNHPDGKENGASSEFFALQDTSVMDDKRKLFDGQFAPFGYIVDGYDLYNQLHAGDVIDQTYVDEWGLLNLVKIRESSFSEVVQSSGDPNATAY